MITDVHTHFWLPEHMTDPWKADSFRVPRALTSKSLDTVTPDSYREHMHPAKASIVFGIQARAAGIYVPNDAVADFVQQVGGDVIGFMSVDATEHGALDEVMRCHHDLGLRGIKLGPIYQGTSPLAPQTMKIFSAAERLQLPVLIHQGAIFATAGRLRDAYPLLLDDVALAFPDLKVIIAHMGHPWVSETVTVMRRHKNIFADVSAIPNRPTMLATALSLSKEYGVFDRVLFGSDSPMVDTEKSVERLWSVVKKMQQNAYTPVEDEELEALLHRPSFDLLGLT